ncbi:hypothetical protein ACQKGL_18625 [Ensifer adhaerens]|uniref:hypothetical protein n=1 Tax=Ensifer adhaerens TaxID=106592 RepID=UPI003D02AA2D
MPASKQEQNEQRKRFGNGFACCSGGRVCRDRRHYAYRRCRRFADFTSRRNGNAGLDTCIPSVDETSKGEFDTAASVTLFWAAVATVAHLATAVCSAVSRPAIKAVVSVFVVAAL